MTYWDGNEGEGGILYMMLRVYTNRVEPSRDHGGGKLPVQLLTKNMCMYVSVYVVDK